MQCRLSITSDVQYPVDFMINFGQSFNLENIYKYKIENLGIIRVINLKNP
jgi:hypothetical protein